MQLNDFKELNKEDLEGLSLWDLLQYYKNCAIINHTKEKDLTELIADIEFEIRDRCQ